MTFNRLKKRYKIFIIVIIFIIIALFCVFGYRLSYKKDIESINIEAVK